MEKEELQIIQNKMPSLESINDMANLFKVFADATRAKILSVLAIKPLCVNDIANILNMTISAISHQLRILREAKLVKCTRDKKEMIYSLDDDHVNKIVACGLDHVNE